MPSDQLRPQRLCLKCAVRKLSGQPEKPCADCLLVNVDPLAAVRANAMKPGPRMVRALHPPSSCSIFGGVTRKPARSSFGGAV